MYILEFSEIAVKQLEKLPKEVQKRIISALERIRVRPQNFVSKLVGEPEYRLRVGDYRVILDIRHEKLVIFIMKIGHRKNIYK